MLSCFCNTQSSSQEPNGPAKFFFLLLYCIMIYTVYVKLFRGHCSKCLNPKICKGALCFADSTIKYSVKTDILKNIQKIILDFFTYFICRLNRLFSCSFLLSPFLKGTIMNFKDNLKRKKIYKEK